MTIRFLIVSIMMSLVTSKSYGRFYNCLLRDFQKEPQLFLSWKNTCQIHAASYACKGGFDVNAIKSLGFVKDTAAKGEVYDFTGTTSQDPHAFENERVEAVLDLICPSGCYGTPDSGFEFATVETCTQPGNQQLEFSTKNLSPPGGGVGAWTFCNSSGLAITVDEMKQKAKWQRHPKFENYYFSDMNTGAGSNVIAEFMKIREKNGCSLQK